MGREKRTCQGKQHFSHPHILKPIVHPPQTLTCNACDQLSITSDNFYGCNNCQYFLHENCLNAPRFLHHSSHPSHHLTLLPVPTYSNRSYTCKACGSAGNGCSFSCACCDFDIHMQCALLPQNLFLAQHHHHELELIFESPFDDDADDESTVFVCDICGDHVDLNYWLYYCADCDFGAHLNCSISKSVSQQEPKPSGNKSNANPIIIKKTEEEPTKMQETNQKEEDEKEELKIARSIVIDKHPHELELCFGSPYHDKDTLFACDLCNITMDTDESLYYCADCDFVLHLQCAFPDAYVFPTSQQRPNPKYPIPNPAGEMINWVKNKVKTMKHFSHPHDLVLSDIQETEEIICSGCEDKLSGPPNYKCTKSNCEFTLHKSCFELPRKIQHNSHPNHPLTLYPTLPERDITYFGCNACGGVPKSFVYECLECNFSLHAKCATAWPENVSCEDHQHSLTLQYEWPFPIENCAHIFCKVCYGLCNDSKWLYYCAECQFGAHLQCATIKKEDSSNFEEEEEEMTNEQKMMMAMIKAQGQQVRLNFQAQMAFMNAEAINNLWRRSYRYY